MIKSNYLIKQRAINLRKKGNSIRNIELELGVSRSTLSGWLKYTKLTPSQKQVLMEKWKEGLKKARAEAARVHKQAKKTRINKIKKQAKDFIEMVDLDKIKLEIFLAGLYLGEGFKTGARTGLGSSSPQILNTFVTLLRKLYNADEIKLRAVIYARADQNPDKLKIYWSKLLNIPKTQFYKTQIDKRTIKNKTFSDYKGVCAVYYFDAAVQRRLMAISEEILGRVAQLVRAFA